MSETKLTNRTIRQGRALVRAIEALGVITPTGPFERAIAGLLLVAYRRRLRAIVSTAPDWVGEKTLTASERIEDGRPAVWMSKN